MKDKDKNQNEHYIYFIETHETGKNFHLSLPKGFEKELFYEAKKNKLKEQNFICLVYRFKIKNNKENYKLTLIEDNHKTKYEKEITKEMIRGSYVHYFLYSIEFKTKKKVIYLCNLSHDFQFKLYFKSIQEKSNELEQKIQLKDLILSTQLLFIGQKFFEFLFYLNVFKKCYTSILVKRQLYAFRFEKLNGIGEKNPDEIEQLKNINNSITNNPNIVLKICKGENERIKLTEILFNIIFYFNSNFQKEKVNTLLENDNLNKNLFKTIIENYIFFPTLSLSKEILNKIIKSAENFNHIKNILKFNNNVYDILFVIRDNIDFILEKFTFKEINEKKKVIKKVPIKIEEYAVPKETDDIGAIVGLIKEIDFFQIESQFIIFSPEFFQKYMELYDGKNYYNLLFLKDIIQYMTKLNPNYKVKHFNKTFHKNGMNLIKQKKLNNLEILDFIQKDNFYNKNYHKYKPDLKVLDGIEFKEIDEDFIKKWETIKWTDVFHGQERTKSFIEYICSFVGDISQFNILFQLLYNKKEFYLNKITIIKTIQKKFIEKCNNTSIQKINEYLYIINDIIEISDKNGCSIEDFLRKIIRYFQKEIVQNIFINALNYYNDISKKPKDIMINFIEKEISFQNQDNIFQILKIIGNKNSEILSRLSQYIIDEEEFYELNDTLNFKILKLLISQNILPDKNSKNSFLKKSFEKIENIKKIIITSLQFTYNSISKFFEKKENKKIYLQRFSLLYFIILNDNDITIKENNKGIDEVMINHNNIKDNTKIKKNTKIKDNNKNNIKSFIEDNIINIFQSISIQFENINNIINSLQIILDDFSYFFPNKHKEDYIELSEIKNKYREKELFKKDENLEKKASKYLNGYLNKAQERVKIKNSILFNSIYEKEKLNNKNGEGNLLEESYKKFNDFKNLFNNNLNNVDKKIIEMFINEFRNKSDNETKEEIIRLIDIFKINNLNNDNIVEELISLLKRETILNLLKSVRNFIKEMEVKQEQYTKSIDTTISLCEKYFGTEFIHMCIDIVKCFGIDLNDKNNQFFNILMKLNKDPEILKYLLKTDIDDCRLLQEIVNNAEDTLLTGADITDFEKCIEFLNKIRKENEENQMTDYKLIKRCIELFNNNPDLGLYFNNFIDHYGEINDLKKQEFDKSEAANQKIKDICNYSIFILSNKSKNFFDGKYEKEIDNLKRDKNQEKEIKLNSITLKELQELKERIQITRNISIDLKDNENIETEKLFIGLITDLNNLYSILNEIYIKGYIKVIQLQIKVNEKVKTFEFIHEDIKKEKEDDLLLLKTDEIKEDNENIYDSKSIISILRNLLNNLKKIKRKVIKRKYI